MLGHKGVNHKHPGCRCSLAYDLCSLAYGLARSYWPMAIQVAVFEVGVPVPEERPVRAVLVLEVDRDERRLLAGRERADDR